MPSLDVTKAVQVEGLAGPPVIDGPEISVPEVLVYVFVERLTPEGFGGYGWSRMIEAAQLGG